MWQWLVVAGSAAAGYGGAAAIFGLHGQRSARVRVAWAVCLCALIAAQMMIPAVVSALVGVRAGVAAVSIAAWALLAGIVVAAVSAVVKARPKIAAGVAAGVCLASAAAWWGAGYAGSGSQYEPAAVASEKSNSAGDALENPECACAARAWCEGPRGGRYCLTDAGARRYVRAEK